MIDRRPSLEDYATHDESRFPELWNGCALAVFAGLGPSGNSVYDQSRSLNQLDIAGPTTADYLWATRNGWPMWRFSRLDTGRLDGKYPLSFDLSAAKNFSIAGFFEITEYAIEYSFPMVTIGTGDWMAMTCGVYVGSFVFLFSQTGTGWTFFYGSSSSLNTLYHFAVTKKGTEYIMYINGYRVSNANYANCVLNNLTVRIGAHYGLNVDYMSNGYIDDVRIYDRTLSPDEVMILASQRGIAYMPRAKKYRFISLPRFNTGFATNSNVFIGQSRC